MNPLSFLPSAVFKCWKPDPAYRPLVRAARATDAALQVRWFGAAGHAVSTQKTTILLDPFFSRPGLLRTGFARLVPDEAEIAKYLPPRVDAIFLGHSHYDHLMDAPSIAKMTGARIVGSASTAAFARAAGVPEPQLTVVPREGASVRVGDVEVRFVASNHGRVFFGRVPFPGVADEHPRLPARLGDYRMGGAYGLLVRAPGATLYHNGSADLIDAELAGERADVLLLCLAGRSGTPGYLKRITEALRPSLIVPTHHDSFFAPLSEGVRLLPRIDLEGFVAQARQLAPKAGVVTPDYMESLAIPGGDAAGAAFVA